jgi:hypothetical protein
MMADTLWAHLVGVQHKIRPPALHGSQMGREKEERGN